MAGIEVRDIEIGRLFTMVGVSTHAAEVRRNIWFKHRANLNDCVWSTFGNQASNRSDTNLAADATNGWHVEHVFTKEESDPIIMAARITSWEECEHMLAELAENVGAK